MIKERWYKKLRLSDKCRGVLITKINIVSIYTCTSAKLGDEKFKDSHSESRLLLKHKRFIARNSHSLTSDLTDITTF